MRILLADPPYYRFFGGAYQEVCLGILYLGTMLERAGHTVMVYQTDFVPDTEFPSNLRMLEQYREYLAAIRTTDPDAHPVWTDIRGVLESFRPDVVGLTLLTPKYGSGLLLARLAKALDEPPTVLVGGAHPTILPEQTLREDAFDICIRGEGETTIVECVAALADDSPLAEIDGLSWTRENGTVRHNTDRGLIQDLDTLPFPNRELLRDRELFPPRALGVLVTSRGCPFTCQFCASHMLWGRHVRYRSIENVLDEVRTIHDRYGTRRFSFFDDTFTLKHSRVEALCDALIDDGPEIAWACTTRADTVDAALMTKMRKAGCEDVFIGIESASNRVLKRIGKRITVEQVETVTRAATDAGLYPCLSFMIGLPGETAREIRKDIAFVERVDPYNPRPNVAKPFPGTEFYTYAREHSILPQQPDWSELSPHNPTHNLAGIDDALFSQLAHEVYAAFHARELVHVRERLARMADAANRAAGAPSASSAASSGTAASARLEQQSQSTRPRRLGWFRRRRKRRDRRRKR